MFLEMYSVKDNEVGIFNQVQCVPHLVEMTRAIAQSMKDPNSRLAIYANSYSLYYVGKFDQDTGQVIRDPSGPRFIAHLSSFNNSFNSEAKHG